MLKALVVGLAIALLLWLVFGRNRRGNRTTHRDGPQPTDAEQMVTCAHCGVHLPRSESLTARGLHYCSPAHRDK